jgi:hypothetical protein
MNRTTLLPLTLVFAILILASCDKDYDLSKDFNTDITLGSQFSAPVGKTDTVLLKRIIKPTNTVTTNEQGIYEVTTKGSTTSSIEAVNKVIVKSFTPIFDDIDVNIATATKKSKRIRNIEANGTFESSGTYTIDEELPEEVKSLNYARFNGGKITTYFTISSPSLPSGIESITLKNVTLTYPEIFKTSNGTNVFKCDEVTFTRDRLSYTSTIDITSAEIPASLQSKYLVNKNGRMHLVVDAKLTVAGSLTASIGGIVTDNSVRVSFKYLTKEDVVIDRISGNFVTNANINSTVKLNDIPNFLNSNNTSLNPTDFNVDFHLLNPTGETLNSDISLTSIKNGATIAGPVKVNLTATPEATNNYIISNKQQTVPAGYTNIVNPDLTTLLNKIPDSFIITSDKIALENSTASQNLDLGKAFTATADYTVTVPLSFNNLKIEYTDSVKGLLDDLKDVADKTNQVIVKGTGVTTIPAQLIAGVELFDINGNKLNGIDIDLSNFKFAPAVDGKESVNALQIILTEKDGSTDLERLEKIKYTIYANSLDLNNVVLKPTQYIVIKDIVATIPNGIDVTL